MERICLFCSKPIKVGRSDKKFCNAGCKDSFYNEMKRAEQGEIGKIDRILKRNRRILKNLFDSERSAKHIIRDELLKRGFDFGFQTHVVTAKNGSVEITFCYDYGYRETKNGLYKVFPFSKPLQAKGRVARDITNDL